MRKFSTNANQLCKNAQMNSWDDVRYFLELARCGSLSGAARSLGVNHSTVARRIAALEKAHGLVLFNRLPNGYGMTEAAEAIYDKALEIEAQNQAVERLLYAGDTRLSGKLVVTMPHDLANYCVMPHLHRFTQNYPHVALELMVSPGLKNLSALEADMAVRLTPSPPETLVGVQLAQLRHGVYFSERYLSSRQNREAPDLIVWRNEDTPPSWAKKHFPNSRIVLKVDDLGTMYAAVKQGLGIARMPCYVPDTIKDPDMFKLPLDLTPSNWGLWVLHHADLRQTARVRVFKEFLNEILRAQRPLIEGELSQQRAF